MNEVATEKRPPGRPPKSGSITEKGQRIWLSEVEFRVPQAVANSDIRRTTLVPDAPLNPGYKVPHISFDPHLRLVVVGRDMYPAEVVAKMTRLH